MSEEFIDSFGDGDFTNTFEHEISNIYKKWPWSKWQVGTSGWAWKRINSGSHDKLNELTKGQFKRDCPEEFI